MPLNILAEDVIPHPHESKMMSTCDCIDSLPGYLRFRRGQHLVVTSDTSSLNPFFGRLPDGTIGFVARSDVESIR